MENNKSEKSKIINCDNVRSNTCVVFPFSAILSFFAFLGVFASIYDVITEHLRARRISTNNLSNNRVSSDVNKSVFKNKAFLPGDFESDSNIRRSDLPG